MTTENSNASSLPLVIIPAAGYGDRVGRPAAKELLLNHLGQPLIAFALNQAKQRQWPVHVITRKEKQGLIDFLGHFSVQNQMKIQIQIIEPSREWPDSVLQSQKFWKEQNLLCLPDTIFEPLDIWESLVKSLRVEGDVALGVFEAQDYSKWGVVREIFKARIELCEKPQVRSENMKAWGLSAFTRSGGLELFRAQLQSTFDHNWIALKAPAYLLPLKDFRDLTR